MSRSAHVLGPLVALLEEPVDLLAARGLRRPDAGHGVGGCGIGASCRLDDIESVNEAGDQDAGVGVSRSCGVNDFTDETGNLDRFASDRAQEAPVGSGTSDDQRPWAGISRSFPVSIVARRSSGRSTWSGMSGCTGPRSMTSPTSSGIDRSQSARTPRLV